MPPAVAKFYCGLPRDQEYMDSLPAVCDETFELSFVGPFVPGFMKEMKMTYTTLPKGLGNLWRSFPDLTFSPQEEPALQADGGWKASTKVTGKHTGPAFSPAPHLDPVPTSNIVSRPQRTRITMTVIFHHSPLPRYFFLVFDDGG